MISEEEKKIILDTLFSIQRNVDLKIEEADEDAKVAKERWEAVMRSMSDLNTNVKLLADEIRNAKGRMQMEHREAVNALTETAEVITEELAPKKIVHIEHKAKAGVFNWIKRFF